MCKKKKNYGHLPNSENLDSLFHLEGQKSNDASDDMQLEYDLVIYWRKKSGKMSICSISVTDCSIWKHMVN